MQEAYSSTAILEAPAFYDYLLNRQLVTFIPKPLAPQAFDIPEDKAQFHIYLSKKDGYDAFATKVAAYLSQAHATTIDPTHLRFTTMTQNTWKPRAPVKRMPNQTVNNILLGMAGYGSYGYNNQASDALYYEIMEMSLTELEQRKTIRIAWLTEGIQKEVSFGGLLTPS